MKKELVPGVQVLGSKPFVGEGDAASHPFTSSPPPYMLRASKSTNDVS
jgi:hypothetical protein